MEYVLLAYGAAFVATGSALAVEARATGTDGLLPRAALRLAAAFALVHGASEWTALGVLLELREHGILLGDLAVARLVLLAGSFAILGAFGLVLVTNRRHRFVVAALGPVAALTAWAIWAGAALGGRGGQVDLGAFSAAEAATRYLLGVPACAAAVIGLQGARRRFDVEDSRKARYIGAAALATAAYGVFTGLVVPPSGVPLSLVLNADVFAARTRVPVEAFRGAAIVVLGLVLSEAFVRRTTERLRGDAGQHLCDGLLSLVAHDLRTPLGTIDTGATLLERLGPDEHASEREARILRAIHESARSMRKIIGDLLDASYVESRRLSIAPERLDLVPLLLQLIEWAPADVLRGHAVQLVPPGPLPPVVADPVRVTQVLTNLLSNAGKYSTPRSVIALEAQGGSREVTISVTNAGEGIPARELSCLFALNYRTRAALNGAAQGLGLGLFIAKGLVESHGGRIWAESEVGKLTTFRFTLPRAPAERPVVAEP